MAPTTEVLVALLVQALREPLRRKELVARFQAMVWEGLDSSISAPIKDVLRELAYDLDLFETRPAVRVEDGSYYGHRRFEEEVRSSLARLRDAGIDVADDL
jgi:hypothetical protein